MWASILIKIKASTKK